MQSVCVVGLGIIGSVWAEHYRSDGRSVRSWNRTPHPECAGFIADLSEAVRGVDVVHICVADPPAVRGVLDVIMPMLSAGVLVIQSSTISPQAAAEFSERVVATGARYVEAPFTGSKPAAEARQLVFFLGGDPAAVEAAEPWLAVLSRRRFAMGSPRQAAAIKLSMNLQIAAVSQALTEGWHLARAYGLTHETFYDVLRENVAHSGLAELKESKLRTGDVSPQFSVKHMRKDLALALEAAQGLDLRLTGRAKEIYDAGIDAGLGDADFIALERLVAAKAESAE